MSTVKRTEPPKKNYTQQTKWISYPIENNVEWKNTGCLHKTLYQMVSVKEKHNDRKEFCLRKSSSENHVPNERKLPEPT